MGFKKGQTIGEDYQKPEGKITYERTNPDFDNQPSALKGSSIPRMQFETLNI